MAAPRYGPWLALFNCTMGTDPSIKIRTIPRSNEKQAFKPVSRSKRNLKWLIAAMLVAIGALGALATYHQQKSKKQVVRKSTARAATRTVAQQGLPGQVHDTQLAEMMLKQRTALENQRTMGDRNDRETDNLMLAEPEERSLGVNFESENTSERVYEDLYGEKTGYKDTLPDDKINARLANRKWLNEVERAERLHFIKNFIRQAYDRGYEVELDQNLVVVGVKKLGSRKVNIDEVLNRLAKQGQ